MSITLDGTMIDWLPSDRLDTPGTTVDGYEIYGRFENGAFFLALRSPVAIAANTTFWMDTDADSSTGHQIWGWAGGAEFNVNIRADGIARLYSGGAGETLIGLLAQASSQDGTVLELQIPLSQLGNAVSAIRLYADVNDGVFLPSNYGAGGYVATLAPTSSFDGLLTDWTPTSRLDTPSDTVPGYAVYGAIEPDRFVFAVQSAQPLGPNSTFWLNTDGNPATGHQIWGWAGGADFNVKIGADGIARLYTGAAGEVFVSEIDHAIAADGLSIEFALDKAVLGTNTQSVTILADINDSVFLPPNFATGGYELAPAATSTFDGLLTEWGAEQRLETPGTGVDGYELYARVDADAFAIALKAPSAIGPNTTFWINADGEAATGHQIWGWAGGAEFNVNIGADGVARLYTGGAGETWVADLDHAYGPDGLTLELAIPKALLGGESGSISILADVNDTVFLPNNYGFGGYVVSVPPVSTFDGQLTEWTQDQRIETPTTQVAGYELYGKVSDGAFVVGLKSAVPIEANTTFWLNTDGQTQTGYQVWGWAVGAEFNVQIGSDGQARLYSGAAGETLIATLDAAIASDGLSMELAIPKALLGEAIDKVWLMADVNDSVHLPSDYTQPAYTITDPASIPSSPQTSHKIAIVFSETTAGAYFSEMAYSQLVMAAQSQAMSAGIPFDLVGEADLTDIAKMSQYAAIVFPSFRNAPANYAEIAAALNTLSYDHDIPIVTSGDFMTNDASGAALPGNPYERMQTLLGLQRSSGENGVDIDVVASAENQITAGYQDGHIRTYTGGATSYYSAVVAGTETILAQQVVGGQTHGAVISTVTGGKNVHFATEGMLADNNLLGQALDWVTKTSQGPEVSLSMSRDSAIVASRNDMDQSQETFDVDGGIYDALLPILSEWKANYNFVGSYYINVGLYAPDQNTNWLISSPYYQQMLAMGNEIGSHSYSHPFDTNLLLPDTVTQGVLDQRIAGYAAMLDNPSACFCPYCVRGDADQAVIDALAQMSVAEINATLQSALAAPDPMALDPIAKAIVEASFRFQFGTSRHVIEDNLGIVVSGAAVPGMPESLETARQIIQYYDYMTGGASLVGAGYPGAFGYLSPEDTGKIYIAPNMSFDFTLLGWQGLNAEQALDKWLAEFNAIATNSDLPIVVWPWHDYGPTQWSVDGSASGSPYTLEMFTGFVQAAHAAGSEFVTLADLAARMATFEQTEFQFQASGDTITVTATPASGTLGAFAINLDDLGPQMISAVTNWYAYDGTSVFLDADGGTFEIQLGTAPVDVTRITSIGARMQLLNLVGDGTNLDFTLYGEGLLTVELALGEGVDYAVTGAEIVSRTGDLLTLRLPTLGTHAVSIAQVALTNVAATDIVLSGLTAVPELAVDRIKIADIAVVDPDLLAEMRNNTVSVSDERFEIDPTDGALYRKAGAVFDYESAPQLLLTITASDGDLAFSKQVTLDISNVNEVPQGTVAITGKAIGNETLSADASSILDPDGNGLFAFQWQRDTGSGFTDIEGARTATYTLVAADHGATIRVVVNFTDAGGAVEFVQSSPTGPVVEPIPVITLAPLIEDTTRLITPDQLLGAGVGGAIIGLTASSGVLAAQSDGTWLFTPAADDDTSVQFSYTIEAGSGSIAGSAVLDLLGLNDIRGTAESDILAARSAAEQYHGGDGADTIRAGNGADVVSGDAGNDTVYGDGGNDIIVATLGDGDDIYTGGSGVDTLDMSRLSVDVNVNLAAGSVTSAQSGSDRVATIEAVITGSGNDSIMGSGSANRIDGGSGNDILEGAGGKDVLIGGLGADNFVFRSVAHSRPGETTRDVIVDFTAGTDRIDLSLIDAASGIAGNQAFLFVDQPGAAFSGVSGQLTFAFEDNEGSANDRTIIAADTNGDRVSDFSIELTGLFTLGAADFIL